MGSIDRYVICATLASLAPIPLSLTGALWIARARAGADRLTPFGFDGGINPAIGESSEHLPRPLKRPVTA
jgi:hypothetical protein